MRKRPIRTGHRAAIGAAIAVAFVSACFSPKMPPRDKRFFAIEPGPPAPWTGAPIDAAVAVRRVRIAPRYEREGFVYRRAEYDFAADWYDQFLIPPSGMIGDEIRRALAAAGVFRTVLGPSGPVDAEYTLEAVVNEMYGDWRAAGRPLAVLEIELFLLDEAGDARSIRMHRRYRRELPLGAPAADALVAGWSAGLHEILDEWIAELGVELSRPRETPVE